MLPKAVTTLSSAWVPHTLWILPVLTFTCALEDLGFRSVMTIERHGTRVSDSEGPNITGRVLAGFSDPAQREVIANTVVTPDGHSFATPGAAVRRLSELT